MVVDSVILARGGSKGIPGKNIIDFCGKPLLAWTIEQCQESRHIRDVWVSSDSQEILAVAEQCGAKPIMRPLEISGDLAASESAWLHALEVFEQNNVTIDAMFAPQVTSPLRENTDIDRAIEHFFDTNCDSMFSCSVAEDLFFWERNQDGELHSVNYDFLSRKRRQDIPKQIIENGSFYIFTPEVLHKYNNRIGGKIGCTEMAFWKMFEIDSTDDLKMCAALMNEFLL